MQIKDQLAALTVLDERGEPLPVAELWREKPVVLVLVRHFG